MSARQIIPQIAPRPCAVPASPMPLNAAAAAASSSTATAIVEQRTGEARAQADLRRSTTTRSRRGRGRRASSPRTARASSPERGYTALGPLVDVLRRNALRTHARHEVERLLKLPLAAANARFAKIRSRAPRLAVALGLAARPCATSSGWPSPTTRAAPRCGDEPEIVELGCLVSDAGAAAQPWHADADATRPNTANWSCWSASTSAPSRRRSCCPARTCVEIKFAPIAMGCCLCSCVCSMAWSFHTATRPFPRRARPRRAPDPPGMPALRGV